MSAPLWLHNLTAYSLQIALLVIAGGLLPACLRLRLPKARLAYWHFLLAACLLLPVVQTWQRVVAAPAAVISVKTVTVAAASAPGRTLPTFAELVLLVLFAGIVTRAVWLAVGFRRLRRYRRRACALFPLPPPFEQLQSRLGAQAELRLSTDVPGPVTFGFRRPVILLPVRFPALAPAVQEAIACHELLHVRRHDWLITVLEEGVRTLLWFHPAIWWLLGQIQLDREQVVDREVVELSRSREQYLEALLAVAETGHVTADLAPAPLFLRKRHLARRVAAILKEVSMSKRRLIASFCTALGVAVLAGWLAVRAFPLEAAAADENYVTIDTGGASLLHRAFVEYPREALQKRVEGAVVLEVSVNDQGLVSDARVLSGPDELRRSALQSVLQWHFSKDQPLPAKTQVTLTFQLPQQANAVMPAPRASLGVVGAVPQPSANAPENADLGVLRDIQIDDLSPAARDALLSRLPVRVGDTILNPDTVARVQQVVRATDEHLMTGFRQLPNGGGVVLSIALAGTRVATGMAGTISPQSAGAGRIRVDRLAQRNNLLQAVRPVYPPEAKQARIQGTVKLEALIAKDGTVQKLTALSGHPLLVSAAMDAVKQWVYRPTLLNGDPVDVITQIEVNFTLKQ